MGCSTRSPAEPWRGQGGGRDPAVARFHETRFFANVCGSTIEDYVETTRRFEDSPIERHRDQHLVPEHLRKAACSSATCRRCRHGSWRVPRGDPQAAHHQAVAEPDRHQGERAALHRSGQRGLAVINTIMGMAIDVAHAQAGDRQHPGRPVGPAIKPIALLKVMQVAEVARPLGIPIHRPGRHLHADDALESSLPAPPRRRRHVAVLRPAGVPEDQHRRGGVPRGERHESVAELIGTLDAPRRPCRLHLLNYSCRSASIGSSDAARRAGHNPNTSPTPALNANASSRESAVT